MKQSVQVLVWLYSRLLRLYPRQYQGAFFVIRLGCRELRDLPGAAIRQHWQERITDIRRRRENENKHTHHIRTWLAA